MTTGRESSDPPVYRSGILTIAELQLGQRFRQDVAEGIDSLAASIKRVGLLHPPVVTEENVLVVGARRVEAYRLLGRGTIPVRFVKNLEEGILLAQRDENVERIDLKP